MPPWLAGKVVYLGEKRLPGLCLVLNALYVFLGEAAVLLVLGTILYYAVTARKLDQRLFKHRQKTSPYRLRKPVRRCFLSVYSSSKLRQRCKISCAQPGIPPRLMRQSVTRKVSSLRPQRLPTSSCIVSTMRQQHWALNAFCSGFFNRRDLAYRHWNFIIGDPVEVLRPDFTQLSRVRTPAGGNRGIRGQNHPLCLPPGQCPLPGKFLGWDR